MKNGKTKIAPILKALEVGDQQDYPSIRYISIRTTIDRIQKATDMKFSTRSLVENKEKIIRITRIQ